VNLRADLRSLAAVLVAWGMLLPPHLVAQETLPEDASLARLATLLAATTSITAHVEQLIIDQDGRELQETSAELQMRKPANFSWQITSPYEELMVTNGTLIWRYEPDLEQVTIQNFDSELDRTPVMLLNGTAEAINAAYAVSATDMDGAGLWRFILLPRKPSSLFERLSLTFVGEQLQEMQFEDSLGQQTSLSFSAVARNGMLDPAQFEFTPPEGVEIIDNSFPVDP
jgi:outer membrane lipoprotein carrier protein